MTYNPRDHSTTVRRRLAAVPGFLAPILLLALLLDPGMARGDGQVFPAGFLWGTATAAHQVEGGNTRNDWYTWELTPGHIRNGDRSGAACEHYTRYPADLDLARALHANAYRMSVEWSRIEPVPGTYDAAQIRHYREMIAACRQRGMAPMVTLHHFTLPGWLAAEGGLESPRYAESFEKFSRLMGEKLGDLVDLWNTQNEPMAIVLLGYGAGIWPPGKRSTQGMAAATLAMLKAHARAYHALRAADRIDADGDGKPCLVGIAHHMRIFEPYRPHHPADIAIARSNEFVGNWLYLEAITRGIGRVDIPGFPPLRLPINELRNTLDYIGLNYYTRDFLRFNPRAPGLADRLVPSGTPVTDYGWEIYPEGFYQLLVELAPYGLPIYITENGIADRADTKRVEFLHDHLHWIQEAIRAGVDVRGYFHWSLMDNFEWHEGYGMRFGLFTIDFLTQARTPTRGAAYFSEVAGSNRLIAVDEFERAHPRRQTRPGPACK